MITINASTRQFNIPGADLVFGVTADASAVTKDFRCPRYVGNNLDLTGCFIRMNYRNPNGEIDSYLVKDVTVDGDSVVFGWELSPKVTMYKGNVSFVMCVTGPDTKVAWHTTLGKGQVLEGLEPDVSVVESETADVVAQLIAMVEAQTEAVKAEGANQIKAVKSAAQNAQSDAVAQIEAKGVNVRGSIPEDYTSLENTVDGLVRGRAGAIVCSVEDSAVVVNDASDMAMQGLRIFGRSTQDGTPTPDAPVEIKSVEKPVVTVCGKNLYDKDTYPLTQGNWVNSDGGISGGVEFAATLSYIPVKHLVGKQLTLNKRPGGGNPSIAFYDMNQQLVVSYKNDSGSGGTPRTFTVPENAEYMRFCTISGDDKIQIEIGSNATEYEPYSGQTVNLTHTLPGIPVTSGGNYTDSDGQQWICDEVDLERGVYVQRVGVRVFTGTTETWKDGTISASGQHYVYLADATVTVLNGSVCSHGVSNYSGSWNTGSYWRSGTGLFQVFSDMSLSEWKDYLIAQNTAGTPVTLQFRMDAPIETPLSETEIAAYRAMHSNYPNTTVLNDAGAHMVVKYAADTKLYIDNKIAALIGG